MDSSILTAMVAEMTHGSKTGEVEVMKGIRRFSTLLAMAVGLAGGLAIGEPVQAENLTIGAAYSLKAAFQEVVPMFESEFGATVKVVYGSSQALRRDVESGAPMDVLLSAVEDLVKLQTKGLTLNGGPEVYAQTSLVFVMSAASQAMPISFHDLSFGAKNQGCDRGVGELRRRTHYGTGASRG
ncbi:MAG: substrate-binding domain-containing protein [Nitrospira sp.]